MTPALRPLIPAADIQRRVAELGAEISARYQGQQLVCVCVLKGAFVFFADLLREITCGPELDFVRLASYGAGTSPGSPCAFTKDIELNVKGKHLLLVEDIVDTGRSAEYLLQAFAGRGAASLKLCAFIDKQERRESGVTVDFAGFSIQKGFIVGYGMDYAEKYRELTAVYELVPE